MTSGRRADAELRVLAEAVRCFECRRADGPAGVARMEFVDAAGRLIDAAKKGSEP